MRLILYILFAFSPFVNVFSQTNFSVSTIGIWSPYALSYNSDTLLVNGPLSLDLIFQKAAKAKYPMISNDSISSAVSLIKQRATSRGLNINFEFKENKEFWVGYWEGEKLINKKFGIYTIDNKNEINIILDNTQKRMKFKIGFFDNKSCLLWEDDGFTFFYFH